VLRRLAATRGVFGLVAMLCAIVAFATVLGGSSGPRLERVTGTALIMLVLVVGIKIFIGDSGIFAFGQVAFMGVGAYTTAISTMSGAQKRFQLPGLPHSLAVLQLPGWEAALLSGLVATLIAFVLSIPLVRLSGLTASLATVAILVAFHAIFQNWETFTRGNAGIILDASAPRLPVLLAWACAAIVVAALLRHSPVGLRLVASREDEVAARAVGIRVWWERGVAFAVSSFIVGVAGSLFAQYFGSVLGTLLISIALEILRTFERGVHIGPWLVPSRPGLTEVGLALLLLLVLLLRPAGLTGGHELTELRGSAIRFSRPGRRHRAADEVGAGAEPVSQPGDRVTDPEASPTGGRSAY